MVHGRSLTRIALDCRMLTRRGCGASPFADLKNVGGKGAGSITAALFLREFVSKVLRHD